MAKLDDVHSDLKVLAGKVDSAINLGRYFVGICLIVVGFLFYFYIPNQLDKVKAEVKADYEKDLLAIATKSSAKEAIEKLPEFLKKDDKKTKADLTAIAKISKEAKQQQVQTDPNTVSLLGKQILTQVNWTQPELNTAGWQAVTNLMEYCSFLKGQDLPNFKIAPRFESTGGWHMDFGGVPSVDQKSNFAFFGTTSAENAARGEHIGEPPSNPNAKVGPMIAVIEAVGSNEVVRLDGHLEKNIVYVGFHILYEGGPLTLDHVTFINCTFEVHPNDKGRDFGRALFAGMPVNFSVATS